MTRASLPDAAYVVLSSRLIPGLDGGYTVATLARARLLVDAGAGSVTLLTVDPGTPEAHAEQRLEFVRQGAVASVESFRNLFDDALADSSWLRDVAVPGTSTPTPTPAVGYRDIGGVVSIPVIAGDPDWHLTDAAVIVAGAGMIAGFRGLYLAWLQHVVAGLRADDPDRVVVLVCESRQLGELVAGWDDPGVRIIHTIHNSHLEPPYDDPEGPINELWRRWFEVAGSFDAVLWPTAAQCEEASARFGAQETYAVVPNAVEPVRVDRSLSERSETKRGEQTSFRLVAGAPRSTTGGEGAGAPRSMTGGPRVVMLNRLAAQKRVDHAIRAWAQVVVAVPGARLDVYGGGPLREQLRELIHELGLDASITLHGHVDDRETVFAGASLFLASPAYEGQGLSTAEALARGIPAVSYDVRYGPRETIQDAGILVPSGDIDGLAAAVIALLQDDDQRAALADRAPHVAAALAPDVVRERLVRVIVDAVARPSRRVEGSAG